MTESDAVTKKPVIFCRIFPHTANFLGQTVDLYCCILYNKYNRNLKSLLKVVLRRRAKKRSATFTYGKRAMVRFYLQVKYIIDFFLSLIAVIVASPVMAAVAIAIKIEDGGKVLLRQERTGKYGKKFTCYKFRSMKSDHVPFDKHRPVIKDNNANLTKVGKVIRKLKIDELPQIVNILKGDMCFIGPRPLLPDYDCEYQEWELVKFEMRPGLTGLSQVRGNGHLSIKARKYYDAYYVMHASPILDLKIIFKTVAVLIVGERRFLKRVPPECYEKAKQEVGKRMKISKQTYINFGLTPPQEN